MKLFVLNEKTKKYHYSNCHVVKRTKKENIRQLDDVLLNEDTNKVLYDKTPCLFCNPDLNQTMLDSHSPTENDGS